MFEGLSPEVAALLDAAAADLPAAQADAGLLATLAEAVSAGTSAVPVPSPRRKSVLGKVITAKVAAIAGVLILTGGVASAATGTLPDPAQDAASSVADVVGLDIPKAHPDNHGKEVSGVAHDKSGDGDENHGARVCAVASQGKCKSGDDATDDESNEGPSDNRGPGGSSADHRQDGEHRNGNSVDDDNSTTSTTIEDNADDDGPDHDADDDNPGDESGKGKDKSGDHAPDDNSGPGSSDDD